MERLPVQPEEESSLTIEGILSQLVGQDRYGGAALWVRCDEASYRRLAALGDLVSHPLWGKALDILSVATVERRLHEEDEHLEGRRLLPLGEGADDSFEEGFLVVSAWRGVGRSPRVTCEEVVARCRGVLAEDEAHVALRARLAAGRRHERRARAVRLLDQAVDLGRAGRWQDAMDLYKEALELSPELDAAREGLDRAAAEVERELGRGHARAETGQSPERAAGHGRSLAFEPTGEDPPRDDALDLLRTAAAVRPDARIQRRLWSLCRERLEARRRSLHRLTAQRRAWRRRVFDRLRRHLRAQNPAAARRLALYLLSVDGGDARAETLDRRLRHRQGS